VPIFAYKGLAENGRTVEGVLDAESARAARARLRRDGVYPTEIAEESAAPRSSIFSRSFGDRVAPGDVALLSRQLATLLSAGVPVVEALAAVGEQADRAPAARVLSHLRDDVSQGTSLADAMAQHPAVFSELYVGMVRAGETAGALDVVLERLASYSESQLRLRARVRNALAYPLLMSAISARILLGASNALTENGLLLLLFLAACVAGAVTLLRRPEWRSWLDGKLLGLPLFGPIASKVAVARFARTLATLLANGIPLLEALELAGRVIGNEALRNAVDGARTAIREGSGVAEPLRRSGLFPPLLVRMIAVGERSGELEPMLDRVADAYEQDVESSLATLTAVLEPVMILVMGGIMVFVVLAILLPIFEINSLVR
jgi:general secretion pathway protein F